MNIAQSDFDTAGNILHVIEDSFIGGSCVVDIDNANDIDIVVPKWAYIPQVLEDMGFAITEVGEDERYPERDHPWLVATWRMRSINIIVVKNPYWVADKASVRMMKTDPDKYKTREQRVELHKANRERVDELLYGKDILL